MASVILITGAQGFMGRYLVADWLAADPEVAVFGIGRSSQLDEQFTHSVRCGKSLVAAPLPIPLLDTLRSRRYRYLKLDMADTASLTQLLADIQPDIIVHLAASLRDDPAVQLVHANIGTVAAEMNSAINVC